MGRLDQLISVVFLLVIAVVAVALVAGLALDQPVLLAYIETGSMEPTIQAGDGYVPIPAILAGEVSEGDVITFDAEVIEGGGLTTHRVVGVTDQGYVTRGDANPVTDQDSGEPAVSDGQVVAVALQVNGVVVRLPRAGLAADAISGQLARVQTTLSTRLGIDLFRGERGLAAGLFALGIGALLVEWYSNPSRRRHGRERTRSGGRIERRYILGGMAIALMIAATVGMLGPAGTTTYDVVSSQSDPDTPRVVQAGGESDRVYVAANRGVLPVYVYLAEASDGVRLPDERVHLSPGQEENLTVVTGAPAELGFYTRSVREYRYLAILPVEAVDALYRVHPLAPLFAINAVIGLSTVLVGMALLGQDTLRMRSRSRGNWFGSR